MLIRTPIKEPATPISTAYLTLVTTTLGIYYLPRLSELSNSESLKKEVIQGYKIILPIAVFCGFTIYILRDIIINLLFTKEFAPMRDLFAWQMLGDAMKIGSWILAYLMLGQAMVKMFIATEIVFGFGFFAWTWILTGHLGFQAAAAAHALNYFIYWMVLVFLTSRSLKSPKRDI